MRRFFILSLIVPAVLAFSITSHAVPITFSYSGIVNSTDGYPDSAPFEAFLGETIYLTYTFESSTADSNISGNGDYLGSITAFEATIGANTYSADTGDIVIINNGVNPDQYLVDIPTDLTGPSVGGIPAMRFNLNFSDFTQSVFGSDALPTVQPEPSDFSEASMWLIFDSPNFLFDPEFGIMVPDDTHQPEFGILMAFGALQAVPVPEPGTLLMLIMGSAGLICQNRMQRKKRR